MKKHLHIKTDNVEIEKVGKVSRVYIKDFGLYEQVNDVAHFEYEDAEVDSNVMYAIKKIVEAL